MSLVWMTLSVCAIFLRFYEAKVNLENLDCVDGVAWAHFVLWTRGMLSIQGSCLSFARTFYHFLLFGPREPDLLLKKIFPFFRSYFLSIVPTAFLLSAYLQYTFCGVAVHMYFSVSAINLTETSSKKLVRLIRVVRRFAYGPATWRLQRAGANSKALVLSF